MQWFRVYHGISTDPKLHKVARAAKVNRGLIIGAWIAILETASQSDPRGSCRDLDDESLAFMVDVSKAVAGRILEAMRWAGMIDEYGTVRAWSHASFKNSVINFIGEERGGN